MVMNSENKRFQVLPISGISGGDSHLVSTDYYCVTPWLGNHPFFKKHFYATEEEARKAIEKIKKSLKESQNFQCLVLDYGNNTEAAERCGKIIEIDPPLER